MKANLKRATIGELLALSRQVLVELRSRDVIRTTNAPTGDYAEWLVQRVVKGTLEPNSNRSWDVTTPSGDRLQVKARVVVDTKNRGQRQLSPFRSWDFNFAVIVLFDDEFKVRKAACLSAERLEAVARYAKHVNGNLVFATDELLSEGKDWTQRLRRAAQRQDR
jgi:hypothetical protein